MNQPFNPMGAANLTRDEFLALRDVKVGKPITPEMQERLTSLKMAAQKLGGYSLTDAGEVRLIQEKAPATGTFPRRMPKR